MWNWAEYIIFWHFKILLCHLNCCRISYFEIQNPILAFEIGPKSHYDIQNPILKFENEPNIVFWHSKSYLAFELRPNIVLWHSKSYFDIQNRAEYRITKSKFCGLSTFQTWSVFNDGWHFCKVWMELMDPFKSYWSETKSVTTCTTQKMTMTT